MTIKSESDREQVFSRRALFIGAVQGSIGLVLAGRMAYLSVFEQEKYKLLAEDNRVQVRLIPPRRGWIVDRNGKPLALNRPDYRLELVSEQVDDLDTTLAQIAQVITLTPEDLARIRKDVKRLPGYVPVEIAKDMPWDQFAAVNVRLPELPGVQPIRGFARYYPDGSAVGHLLGYVGTPTREQFLETKDPLYVFPGFRLGKDGIEKMLDDPLRGKAGARRSEVNARGRIIRDLETVDDTPGKTVKLTIDRDLQAYAARRLGEESASVVIMDCWTGDVLCQLSMPAFDPNDFSDGISHTEWNTLTNDERHPLINKTVQGIYPPGSTFKMMTALAILNAGFLPSDGCSCSGRYYFGGHAFHCHKRGGHGFVSMPAGIYQSCDTYFYHYGKQVGIDAIAATARKFGLGQEFDLPLPSQRSGIVPDQAWKMKRYDQKWLPGETLSCAIGQGYNATTPLQLAVMTARIASGLQVEPNLLAGARRKNFKPLDVPVEHLALVRQAMSDVVNSPRGTAGRARLPVPAVHMAGKTGTAQVRRITAADRRRGGKFGGLSVPWKHRDHALFVAFAPVEAPRYAMSIIVEHGISGSGTAGPIARDIMTYLFAPEVAMKNLEKLEADWAEKKRKLKADQEYRAMLAARAAAQTAAGGTPAATTAATPPAPTPAAGTGE
ncbi:penicillin-binding protein 2 [Sphingoaurantiacus capsulatus]|uniref:Penicillin-binding protein 2 n=1 Tax=Sphingoaurantiacus capsulatus TaxID=1771310 RepID=A0ABV7XFK8_9SPHN